MTGMKGFRDWQKSKKIKEKEKDGKMIQKCMKQFPDCPEEPNDVDCHNCPFKQKKKFSLA